MGGIPRYAVSATGPSISKTPGALARSAGFMLCKACMRLGVAKRGSHDALCRTSCTRSRPLPRCRRRKQTRIFNLRVASKHISWNALLAQLFTRAPRQRNPHVVTRPGAQIVLLLPLQAGHFCTAMTQQPPAQRSLAPLLRVLLLLTSAWADSETHPSAHACMHPRRDTLRSATGGEARRPR